VDGEAPPDTEIAAGYKPYRSGRISEVVVQMNDTSSAQFSCESDTFDEVRAREEKTAHPWRAVAK
jgi:hypothetical protein